MSSTVDEVEGLAGILSLGSGFAAFLMFTVDELSHSIQFLAFLSGFGLMSLGVFHTYKGLFEDKDTKNGDAAK